MKDDLEITKACALAMGYDVSHYCLLPDYTQLPITVYFQIGDPKETPRQCKMWNPLHDDAQTAALVKKLGITVCFDGDAADTHRWEAYGSDNKSVFAKTWNRAICQCVASLTERSAK